MLVKGLFVGQAALAVQQDYDALRPLLAASPAELAQPASLVRMEALLSRTESDLRSLREQVGPLSGLAPLVAWVPRYGGDIEQAAPLLDYAIEAAVSGRIVLRMYRSVVTQVPAGGELAKDGPRGQLLLSVLDSVRASTDELRIQLGRTASARQKIEPRRLSASFAGLIRRGDTVLAVGGPALDAVEILPSLLGMRGARQYLLIAQNNDEMRATGGFISGVGTIQVQDGKITQVDYQDSYAVEDYSKPHPWPPKPLTDYMGAELWVVRDANWSPDFPTTAKNIEQLYELNRGTRVDGVIAVNLNAVQRLVAALAPVDLPDYGERVDGGNVLARMEYYFASPAGLGQTGDWWSHRKDFMAALMQTIVARLNGDHGALSAPRIGQALWENLSAKDILVYVNDPATATILRDLRWDGALPSVAHDVVMVVDSNVGFNKVDRQMERRFDYRVELNPGQRAVASLRIQYRNLNPPAAQPCVLPTKYAATYAEMANNCYWDYVRVYVPRGSKPLSATSDISATLESPELGYTVFSGYFVLPRGETREIRFDYELPFDGLSSHTPADYQLTWIKQAGTASAPVSVTLVFPSSFGVGDAETAPVSQGNSAVVFALAPDGDARLSAQFAPAAALSATAVPVPVKLPTVTIAPSPAATVTPVPTATQTTPLAPTATSTRVPIPSPSATAPAPTATAIQSPPTAPSAFRHPAPRLLAPGNGLTFARVSIDLKWSPVGNLQADEWYDVQVWKPDETPHGVSWTKEGAWTMPADFPSGKYQWRIVVIRGQDGKWLEDVSPPSETWTLNRQ